MSAADVFPLCQDAGICASAALVRGTLTQLDTFLLSTSGLAGTSGAKFGLLNGNLTLSGSDTFSGTANFTGTFKIGGVAYTVFGNGGQLAGVDDYNVYSFINDFSGAAAVILPAATSFGTVNNGTCSRALAVNSAGTPALIAIPCPQVVASYTWVPGQDLSAHVTPIYVNTTAGNQTALNIKCRIEVAVGGTATIDVYRANNVTALGSGTKISSTSCNANATAPTVVAPAVTSGTVGSSDTIGIVAAGAGWASSVGLGTITVSLQ
jgi:hypothetical protein